MPACGICGWNRRDNEAALPLYRAAGYQPTEDYRTGRNPAINWALARLLDDRDEDGCRSSGYVFGCHRRSATLGVLTATGPGTPVKMAVTKLPKRLEDLEGWLIAILRSVPPERMFAAVARAEREAGGRFPPRDVVAAMRRVMSRELTRT